MKAGEYITQTCALCVYTTQVTLPEEYNWTKLDLFLQSWLNEKLGKWSQTFGPYWNYGINNQAKKTHHCPNSKKRKHAEHICHDSHRQFNNSLKTFWKAPRIQQRFFRISRKRCDCTTTQKKRIPDAVKMRDWWRLAVFVMFVLVMFMLVMFTCLWICSFYAS